jgi:bis(5'-nucleosyl)-tetraphosphatase (symmetrical)
MALYFVGDIQGCLTELKALLSQVNFTPKVDELWLVGDLVARGPHSLETLRFIKSLGDSAKTVLGNHDLHLLATYAGLKKAKKNDFLHSLLSAHDVDELMNWLAKQPLLRKIPTENTYMSHAGLSPQWSIDTAVKQADIAQQYLASNNRKHWLNLMYEEQPNSWEKAVTAEDQFRYTINALTRMRYCILGESSVLGEAVNGDGALEFQCKAPPAEAPKNLTPWFNLTKLPDGASWIFGHWATLMGACEAADIYALDTGCVWGEYMTLLRWEDKKIFQQKAVFVK